MDSQTDLLQIVDAAGAPRRFASGLHGRQQEGDQDGDDRNDDQKFDERETDNPPQGALSLHGAILVFRVVAASRLPRCSQTHFAKYTRFARY
jgi:hypothetical protein